MKIYRSCNPSEFVKHEEIHGILKVKMSCGGGMGGAQWHEYIQEPNDFELEGESPVWVTNYLGEEMLINPRFIVKASRISIVKVVEDITAWKRALDGKQYLQTMYIEISPHEAVTLVDEYKYVKYEDKLIKSVATARAKY